METMWTIITRHPSHAPGKWTVHSAIYETKALAIAEARKVWDGTGIEWRLMCIPVDEEEG
jgi:hypothetical protein